MLHHLSPTDLCNLSLSAQDLSYKEIAAKRNRSPRTIEAEFNAIKQKLNVNTIQGATARFVSLVVTAMITIVITIAILSIVFPFHSKLEAVKRIERPIKW